MSRGAGHSQAPHINLWPILSSGDEELGSSVLWTAAVCLQQTTRPLVVAQTKVCMAGGHRKRGSIGASMMLLIWKRFDQQLTNYFDVLLLSIQ